MKVHRKARLTGALVTLAGTGALVAFGSAGAFTGQAGSGGPPTSSAPDLITAKVVRAVAPNDTLGPQVSYCFDSILDQNTINPVLFGVGLYDTDQRIGAASATIDTDPATQGKCVRATFTVGADISQGSVAYVGALLGTAPVKDNAGVSAPDESAPLDGNGIVPALTAVAGATTRPDLVSVSVDPGAAPPQVTY
ncbi:MAG: hypothetical protein QOF76_5219, partial [Solirubrobacteraceae bacterium]|nr:hypothetical protein [Solirubrobacteraceae bacterium]